MHLLSNVGENILLLLGLIVRESVKPLDPSPPFISNEFILLTKIKGLEITFSLKLHFSLTIRTPI